MPCYIFPPGEKMSLAQVQSLPNQKLASCRPEIQEALLQIGRIHKQLLKLDARKGASLSLLEIEFQWIVAGCEGELTDQILTISRLIQQLRIKPALGSAL